MAPSNDPESTPPSMVEPFKGGREPSKVGGPLYLIDCVQEGRRLLGLPLAPPPSQASEPATSGPSATAPPAVATPPTSAPQPEAPTGPGSRFSQRLGAMEAAVLQMSRHMDLRFSQLSQARPAFESSERPDGADNHQQQVVGRLVRFSFPVSGAWEFSSSRGD